MGETGTLALIKYYSPSQLERKKILNVDRFCTQEGSISLHEAAHKANLALVEHILTQHPSVSLTQADKRGFYPIHYAARSGSIACVNKLLEKHAGSIDLLTENSLSTVLHCAAKSGNLELVKQLYLQYTEHINSQCAHINHLGKFAIHCAAQSGNVKLLEYLLPLSPKHSLAALTDAGNAVLLAAEAGALDMVRHLVEVHKLAFSLPNQYGNSLVHMAAKSGHLSLLQYCVELFKQARLMPFARNADGQSPLFSAVFAASVQAVCYLLDQQQQPVDEESFNQLTPLLAACHTGSVDLVQCLLEHQADPTRCQPNTGRNLMHFAVSSGSQPLVAYLVEHLSLTHALLLQADNHGMNILHYAASSGVAHTLGFLLDHPLLGARLKPLLEFPDGSLRTPLHVAVSYGNLEGVKLLAGHAASMSARQADGNTPLLSAAVLGSAHLDLVQFLLQATPPEHITGCNVKGENLLHLLATWCRDLALLQRLVSELGFQINQQTSAGSAPVHQAAEYGNVAGFLALLDLGANPQLLTLDNETVLHKIARCGSVAMAEVLFRAPHHGSHQLHQRNNDGQTPVLLAGMGLNYTMVEFLLQKHANVTEADAQGFTLLHHICKTDVDLARVDTRLQLLRLVLKSPEAWKCLYQKATHVQVTKCRTARGLVPYEVVSQMTPFEMATSADVRQLLLEYDPTIVAKEYLIPFSTIKQYCLPNCKLNDKEGAHSEVYKGSLHGTPVAIKRLLITPDDDQLELKFLSEVGIMGQLHHPNICLLMAACFEPPNLCLVMEHCPNTLYSQISNLNFFQMLEIAKDVSRGMLWLHSRKVPILHCDLKPANILLTSEFRAKITDFGISLLSVKKTTNPGLYAKILPPEFTRDGPTIKGDIYAFGLCCLLMYFRTAIVPEMMSSSTTDDFRWAWTTRMLQLPSQSGFVRVIRDCCMEDPEKRLDSFADILAKLDSLPDLSGEAELQAEFLLSSRYVPPVVTDIVGDACNGYV